MRFDPDEFVAECVAASGEADDREAVAELVQRYVEEATGIDDPFTDASPGPVTLHATPELTIQRIKWAPGFSAAPHDHRMWAVVGVYAGAEHNHFHRRGVNGLEDAGGRVVSQAEVLVLGPEAIHSVTNPSRGSALGLHVYGGDIDNVPRSEWRPNGTEGPLAEVRAEYNTMWAAARDLGVERELVPSDAATFDTLCAINDRVAELGRTLTPDEVRHLLIQLWALDVG